MKGQARLATCHRLRAPLLPPMRASHGQHAALQRDSAHLHRALVLNGRVHLMQTATAAVNLTTNKQPATTSLFGTKMPKAGAGVVLARTRWAWRQQRPPDRRPGLGSRLGPRLLSVKENSAMRLSRRDFWWLSHVQCHQVTTTIHWSIELAIHAPCKGPSLDDALRPTNTVGSSVGRSWWPILRLVELSKDTNLAME